MSARFEELDRRPTRMGEIVLRRRLEPSLHVDVYEVKLDDEFLMSSLFTVAEIQLAKLALAEIPGSALDVMVGGLGLGYTASAVLDDPRVQTLHVVEALAEVIEWHQHQLLPLASVLTGDPRCHLVEGDFFGLVTHDFGTGPHVPRQWHAVLVDIDHTPRHLLHPSHAAFYEPTGLRRVANHLYPGGVFALWSDGQPDREFLTSLEQVFASCEAHLVRFPNFNTDGESASTVYVAQARR
ncbi:MAG: spermidine synthase [Acidimicrobiia bacterium]